MNTNEIFNQMLSSYDITTELQKRNAIFEVNQQIILSGLYNGGFFNEAAFYGGTCLRIFHGLQRFSEDMAIYSMVKTNTFNGMALPSIAVRDSRGDCHIVRKFDYEDFRTRLS